jgi:hypothetical protein
LTPEKALFALSLAALLASLSGCTWPKRFSDIDTPTRAHTQNGPVIPTGIRVAARDRHLADIDGMYPTPATDPLCCWLAPDARVLAIKTSPAKRIVITLLEPPFAFFVTHGQTVTISLKGAQQKFSGLQPGVHRLSIDLDTATSTFVGDLPVSLHFQNVFVPAHEGVNADPRSLGIVLIGITFRS